MALRFSLRQIAYFVAVGELGSITLAAERLHISSPSISTAISQLEKTFGLQFFIRQQAQGLAITPEGRRFLVKAKALLAQAQALHGLADEISGSVQGEIGVGSLVTLAPIVIPALRRGFEARYTAVRVRQHTAHQAALIDHLRSAKIDVAITYDLEIPRDVVFEPLASLPPYAVLPADHRLATRKRLTLKQLCAEPLILLDLPLSGEYFLSLFLEAGLKPLLAERVSDITIIRSMVANGFGYSLANLRPANQAAPDGRELRHVRLAGELRPMVLGMATASERARPRVLSAFEEHCREQITNRRVPGAVPA